MSCLSSVELRALLSRLAVGRVFSQGLNILLSVAVKSFNFLLSLVTLAGPGIEDTLLGTWLETVPEFWSIGAKGLLGRGTYRTYKIKFTLCKTKVCVMI